MVVVKEISVAFLPLTIIKLIFGIGVIEYPLGTPRSTLSLIHSSLLFILAVVSSNIFIENYNELGDKVNINAILFDYIWVYGNLLFHLIAIIEERIYRKEFQQCIQKMSNLNTQFGTIGIPEKYIRLRITSLGIGMILILLNAYFLILTFFLEPLDLLIDRVMEFLTISFLATVPLTVELHFLILISYLRRKFQQLNNSLQKLTGCDSLSTQFEKVIYYKIGLVRAANFRLGRRTTDDVKTLRTAKEIHLDLVKICETINDIFGFQLCLSMPISISLLTIICLEIYRFFFLPLPKNQQNITPNYVLLPLCLYTIKLLIVNHVCYITSEEASNTKLIVCELHEPITNPEFREELDEFVLQLQQNPLIFTAHGFFTLDHNFIQTIVGIVTTYIVILVQFQVQSEQS